MEFFGGRNVVTNKYCRHLAHDQYMLVSFYLLRMKQEYQPSQNEELGVRFDFWEQAWV